MLMAATLPAISVWSRSPWRCTARWESPRDKIVWDTSNQTYPHKLVTGRAADFPTLRQPGGLSGFAAREESPHDIMGAGHAGTGVSAGVGIAVAAQLRGENSATVAVIGDGLVYLGRRL